MAAGRDQAYSTLEAILHHQTCRQEKLLPTDLGKQVAPDDGKQYTVDGDGIEVAANRDFHLGKQVAPDDGKQYTVDGDGIEVAANRDFHAHDVGGHHIQVHQPSRRKWILIVGAVGLIAILAGALGGVFGSRHTSSATASPKRLSNSSTISPSARPLQHNIAALSFALNSVNNTRIYFQDDMGQIMEAANSAANNTWSINRTGISGKNGSAIAAAVSRPDFPLVISVFYLDSDNLIHDMSYNTSTGKWNLGALSDQGYTVMPNSSLTALYNQCKLCANTTIIAFQDENGFIQISNSTSGSWTLTQLGPALDPEMGTGLALQPFYRNGLQDQINLFHQKSNLNMSLASWKPAFINNGVDGWSLNEQIYYTIPSGSPIAAASSYSNVSTGYETWIEVLSLSNEGIEVNTWSGVRNDWLERYTHPSVMVNLTSKKKTYRDIAVTATGNAFGVVIQDGQADGIENWQVADDMVDWSLIGNVDLGGAWG